MYDHGAGVELTGNIVGNIRRLRAVESPQLGNHRDVLVYLPPSYPVSGRHYPTIYMHDGQNLFDAATSYAGEWQVDETMERIAPEGIEAIVIAVPNMGAERIAEYAPFRDERVGGGRGDAYLAFLVDTLKPDVDRNFRTRRDAEHTGIIGSSMGGLISLYAFLTRPDVFGFAGVMSPSLWFARRRDLRRGRQRPTLAGTSLPGHRDGGRPAAGAADARDGADAAQARRAPASADSLRRGARCGAQRDGVGRALRARGAVAAAQASPRHQLVDSGPLAAESYVEST